MMNHALASYYRYSFGTFFQGFYFSTRNSTPVRM